MAAIAKAEVPESGKAESAPPDPVAAMSPAEVDNTVESESSSLPTVIALTAPEEATEPALAVEE